MARTTTVSASTPTWKKQFDRHAPWLRTVIGARLDSRHDAEDVLQEVFADALAQPPEKVSHAAPWLYRIAIHKVMLLRRKYVRRRRIEHRYLHKQRLGNDSLIDEPLQLLLQRERQTSIRQILDELGGPDKEILMLKYEHGWSYQVIAENLGIDLSKVAYRLRMARLRLRQQIESTL